MDERAHETALKNWLMLKLKNLPPDEKANMLLDLAWKSNVNFLHRCMIERGIVQGTEYYNETHKTKVL